MANILSGQIIAIGQTQTIPSKNGGNPLIKREFVIRALRFNPNDGTPELSQYNTPILEFNGQDNVTVLDGFRVGECVKVEFSVEGRSVQNQDGSVKYFDTVRAYRIERINVSLPAQPAQQPAQQQAHQAAPAPNIQGIPQPATYQGQQQYSGVQPHVDQNGNPLPF